jgi:hypothetical protein
VIAKASASDNVAVTKVEFFVNGSLKCSDSTSPYSCTFKMPEGNNIQVMAKSHDAAGNSKESEIIVLTNPGLEPPIKAPIEVTSESNSLPVYNIEGREPVSCGTVGAAAPAASTGTSLQSGLTLIGGVLVSFMRKALKWIKALFK